MGAEFPSRVTIVPFFAVNLTSYCWGCPFQCFLECVDHFWQIFPLIINGAKDFPINSSNLYPLICSDSLITKKEINEFLVIPGPDHII